MSTLYVVRHAQASFFAENYDRLSDLGERQASLLGQYWAQRGARFDEVYTGPRQRQIETARLVGEAFQASGSTWPEAQVLDEFDEYQAEAVLKQSLPALIEQNPRIRDLHAAVTESNGREATLRNFQRMYEVVIGGWARGELPLAEIESWPEFCTRVERGLTRIVDAVGRSRTVVLFTSGGPIGVAMQRALEMPTQKALEVAWMVRNAATSEFLFSPGRFTLSRFNTLAHLDDPALWTYR